MKSTLWFVVMVLACTLAGAAERLVTTGGATPEDEKLREAERQAHTAALVKAAQESEARQRSALSSLDKEREAIYAKNEAERQRQYKDKDEDLKKQLAAIEKESVEQAKAIKEGRQPHTGKLIENGNSDKANKAAEKAAKEAKKKAEKEAEQARKDAEKAAKSKEKEAKEAAEKAKKNAEAGEKK
jgi:hypothetical protein